MDPDERLTALKKAYADIILNASKEAGARIMASERRALRFQHELYVAKEEALQMLFRLKQMMDSKSSEAAMASLSQQRKIEELEAQLHEAEDIVNDLREELREVQAELERVTNNKKLNLDEHNIATPEETSEENRLCTSQSFTFPPPESQHVSVAVSDIKNPNLVQRSAGHKCFNAAIMGNSYVGNPNLPSIILRSKEPNLYRNGCTQRIRACERNLLDGELSVSEQLKDFKHETSAKEDEEAEMICTAPMHEADNMCDIEKKEVVQENSRLRSWYQVRAVKCSRRKMKRGTGYRKSRTPSSRYLPDKFTKMEQARDISCSKSNLNSVENTAQSEEDASKIDPRLSLETMETGKHLGCATESDAKFVKACDVQNITNKGETLIDNLMPKKQESGCTESSSVSVCKMDLEKVDVPLANLEFKANDTTKGLPSHPINNRIIKYTFQRKRKRESLSSSDGNASLEKSTLKKNTGEKQNGSLEPQKSSLITESSRESRRLAQVARQLISLSEKTWWQ